MNGKSKAALRRPCWGAPCGNALSIRAEGMKCRRPHRLSMASAMRTDVAEADAEALDGFDPEQVGMMAEAVILVDEMDRPLGRASKVNAHRAGAYHRAFSVMLFDQTAGCCCSAVPTTKSPSRGSGPTPVAPIRSMFPKNAKRRTGWAFEGPPFES